jgi:hypothetical protein
LEPPPKPSSQLKPVEPQRRLQERLEKPLALRCVEPRPALHRRLSQINAPQLASLKAKFSKGKSKNEKRKYAESLPIELTLPSLRRNRLRQNWRYCIV